MNGDGVVLLSKEMLQTRVASASRVRNENSKKVAPSWGNERGKESPKGKVEVPDRYIQQPVVGKASRLQNVEVGS